MAGQTMRQLVSARAAVALPFASAAGVVWGRPRITGPASCLTGH